MSASLAVAGGLSVSALIAGMTGFPDPGPPILWTAGVLGALGVIYRFLHVGEIVRGTLNFLRDYNGEPERPGAEARPGLPDRIAKIEKQTHEIKGRDAQLVVALEVLADSAKDNGVKIDRLDERAIGLDERITDHRRRNDEQAAILRAELERRAADLEEKLAARNEIIDERLSNISVGLQQADAMRAALVELGLPIERPER